MPSIFTGEFVPLGSGVESTIGAHETLPKRLRNQGYETIGFTPNPFTSRHFNFDRGFDTFEDFVSRDTTVLHQLRSYVRDNWQNRIGGAIRLGLNLIGQGDITVGWRDYYDEVIEAVESASQPFFLWIFLLEPHWPYVPSKNHRDNITVRDFLTNYKRSRISNSELTDTDRDRLLRLYRNTIKDVSDFVNQLQEDLTDHDPAYIFHSDHGEAFGEHGNWGHKGDLYEENVHVPLEIWNVGISETVRDPISLKEIPNIIDFLVAGEPEKISSLSTPVVSARNGEHLCIVGRNWIHFPSGNAKAPDAISSLAEEIYMQEQERATEQKRIIQSAKAMNKEKL
jgi:arylsulfatase